MNNERMTIKDYAESRNKTTQAVYKQLHGKSKANELKGHVEVVVIGGKKTTLLDDEAINILDSYSKQTPNIVVQHDNEELLKELRAENESLKAKMAQLLNDYNVSIKEQNIKITELTDRMLLLTDKHNEELLERDKRVIELTERLLELTEKQETENKSFWNRIFK